MKLKIATFFMGLIILVGCAEEFSVENPIFDVSVASSTVQTGEDVNFTITGDVDNIWFYSGEVRKDYQFKDGRIENVSDAGATISFRSAVTGGTQENQLSVLYSTDFDGNYDNLTSVKSATWNDITESITLGTSPNFENSGTLDISTWLETGKPIYFAFKYITKPQEENGLARTWMIENFTVKSKKQLEGLDLTVCNQIYSGFRIIDENQEKAPARSVITSTRVSLLGNVYKHPDDPIYDPDNPIYNPSNPIYDPGSPEYDPTAELPTFVPFDPNSPYNDPMSEHWAISAPVYINEIDFGPDLATPLKSKESQIEEFLYSYSKAGTYKAYFVGSNNTVDNYKEIVKMIEITVTD